MDDVEHGQSVPILDDDNHKTVRAVCASADTLDFSVQGTGSLQFSPTPLAQGAGFAKFEPDTNVTVTAAPAASWRFGTWSGALSGSANPASITMDGNKTISATFIQTFLLLTGAQGEGTVEPSAGQFDAGTVVTLTATPAPGWRFVSWSNGASGTCGSKPKVQRCVIVASPGAFGSRVSFLVYC